MAAELFHADGRTDRQTETDMTNPNFSNSPNKKTQHRHCNS
jgi:hypothetical protein